MERNTLVSQVLRAPAGELVNVNYCGKDIVLKTDYFPDYVRALHQPYATPEYYGAALWKRVIGSKIEITVNEAFIRDGCSSHPVESYEDDTIMHMDEINELLPRLNLYAQAINIRECESIENNPQYDEIMWQAAQY